MNTPGDKIDIAVVGAGVVGLACAAELARAGRSVVVLERHAGPAQETSSRNSEVIHAGIYYAPGSLKATSCVAGRVRLYERCARLGIPHRKLGKLIVARSDAEIEQLDAIRKRALANGAGAIETLDAPGVTRLEARVRARAALLSPETGIIDAHALCTSYQAELESLGGGVVFNTSLEGLSPCPSGWRLETRGPDGEAFALEAENVLNAAGLESDRVAALAGIDVDARGWRIRPCKGDYFSLAPGLGALAERLIYPVPAGPGLGIHLTLDLAGRIRLGPDAEYVERDARTGTFDYRVAPDKAAAFADAVRGFLPEVSAEALQPEMAGIRPKLQGPGDPVRDFVVEEVAGVVHLVGIESPGLTASPALAELAAQALGVAPASGRARPS